MALGKYRIMKPLKDEDRWLKFFTKKQFGFLIPAGVLSFVLYKVFTGMELRPVGIMSATLIMMTALFVSMYQIPNNRYMISGGRPVYVVLFRLLRKSMKKNKVVYTKNYETIEDE